MSRDARTRTRSGAQARWATLAALAVGSTLLLAGCGVVGDAQARALENELEAGHEAAFYADQLEQQGYQVRLADRSAQEIVLLATREPTSGEDGAEGEAYEVHLNRAEPGAEVESLTVATMRLEDAPSDADPVRVTIPSGATIPVTLQATLSSEASKEGDAFTMTANRDFRVDGATAIPEGTVITGTVTRATPAKRPESGGVLVLAPGLVRLEGRTMKLSGSVTADGEELEGEASHSADWKKIAAGAGVGGILGGVLKGGKGALAGVVLGGGGAFLATKGEELELPTGAQLTLELTRPATVSLIY